MVLENVPLQTSTCRPASAPGGLISKLRPFPNPNLFPGVCSWSLVVALFGCLPPSSPPPTPSLPAAALQFQPGFDPCQMKASGGGGGVFPLTFSLLRSFLSSRNSSGISQIIPKRLSTGALSRDAQLDLRPPPSPAGRRPLDSRGRPRHKRVLGTSASPPSERPFHHWFSCYC